MVVPMATTVHKRPTSRVLTKLAFGKSRRYVLTEIAVSGNSQWRSGKPSFGEKLGAGLCGIVKG
jgi:hypothetical protein